jgi:hypothetical protein
MGVTAAVVFAGLITVESVPVSAATVSDPLAEGLALPLGLAVGNDGTIYVGEADAGLLTTIDKHGNRDVLVDGLGTEIVGVDATGRGTVVYTQTVYDPAAPPDEPPPALEADLKRVRPNGKTSALASTLAHEEEHNPDSVNDYAFQGVAAECLDQLDPELMVPPPYSGIVETHPYAVAIVDGGWVVADAAGNDLVKVTANGRVSTLAVLPPVPNLVDAELAGELGLPDCLIGATYYGEPVPTDVEVGPDGWYYVSSLPGGPELPGTGSVWRVNPRDGSLEHVATGLTGAVDLAVADDGTIYVAELFADQISTVVGGAVTPFVSLSQPGAIEVGPDGTLYATSEVFGNGTLVTITP